MQITTRIGDSLTNKITFYHLIFFLALLPFDQLYSQLALISLTIHSVIHLKKREFLYNFKNVVILQSVFFATLISVLYSTNLKEAINLLTRQAAIFVFPLLFFINPIDLEKHKDKLLLTFAATCTLAVLYLYLDAFRIIAYYKFPVSYIFTSHFINHNFSEPIGLHATYFSLFIALSLIIIADYVLRKEKLNHFLAICCFIILFAGLIQSGSKSVLIAFLVSLSLYVTRIIKTIKFKWIAAILFPAILVTFIILKIPNLKERYFTTFQTDLASSKSYITDSRFDRWMIATDLIKNSPVIGYGSGDEVKILKEAYFNNKLYSSFVHNLNIHNQYLSFLLTGGAFALMVYLFTIGYGLKIAITKNDFVYLSFLIIVIVVSLSENYLYRNKGIFFYAFFMSFFSFLHHQKKYAGSATN